ncbi:MAG: UbiA-like polyprenyltransferase [Bacteroidota bacterium]
MNNDNKNKGLLSYLSLIKFSHTVFALPFAFVGFFLALRTQSFEFTWIKLIYIILCMVFARTAAMSFNRYADRNIDRLNERTSSREIPSGKIKPGIALLITVISSVGFIIICYFINRLVLYLSPVALLVILGYSFTKRFTWLCHFILGIGLSLAPVGAYLAVTSEFSLLPVLLGFIVLLWTAGFDIIYSLQDEHFDKTKNLFSIPARMGKKGALIMSLLIHSLAVIILIYINVTSGFKLLFITGSVVFTLLLFYQHYLVIRFGMKKINLAFFTTNGMASILFSIFFILDFYFPISVSL